MASLSPELKTRLGAAARRGSAPVIDTHSATHIARLHALVQSQRSISPTPIVQEPQTELGSPELHTEASVLQTPPVCAASEYRRLSDTSIRPLSGTTSENLTLPVPSGRRHSDLSSLLSLNSHHKQHFAMPRTHMCQACFYLLLLRSQERSSGLPCFVMPGPNCPCDLKPHPPSGGTTNYPGYGRLKGSSDCSDFSLLQKSLFNIIGRKSAACHVKPTQSSLLHPSAANRLARSDRDGSLKSHLLSSVGDQEPLHGCEDKFFAGEQDVTRAVGVVGHRSRRAALASHLGLTPA